MYTKSDFGRELAAEVRENFDAVRIGSWAFGQYLDHTDELDDETYDVMMDVAAMEKGKGFEKTKEQLLELAVQLQSETVQELIDKLFKLLSDPSAKDYDRHDAILRLYEYDDPRMLEAFFKIGSNKEEQDILVLDDAGEGIGEIWSRNNVFDSDKLKVLTDIARDAAIRIIKRKNPELLRRVASLLRNNQMSIDNLSRHNIYIGTEMPQWVIDRHVDHLEDCPLEAEYGIKCLLIDTQYYLEEQQLHAYFCSIKQATSIEGLERCTQLMIDFNPKNQILYLHEASVYRNGVIINKLDSAEFHVLRREYQAEFHVFSGDITLSAILSDIKLNDIIKFSYTILDRNKIKAEFFSTILFTEYENSIFKLFFTLIFDQRLRLNRNVLGKKVIFPLKNLKEK